MKIYPAIDLLGGRCVRLRQGDYAQETIFSEDPLAVALHWVSLGAKRLHLVDLDGAKAGRPVNGTVIQRIARESGVPVQLGGGIRNADHLATIFNWGVQWGVLGTKALQDPAWVRSMAVQYPERIVLGLDARNGFVASEGWLHTSTTKATELAKSVEDSTLYAVVYTDIARDGMMVGPNEEALMEMRSATRLPVIASGGISTLDQAKSLAKKGAFAGIIGRALYEGAIALPDLMKLEETASGEA